VASAPPLGLSPDARISAAQLASLRVLDAYDLRQVGHRLRVKMLLPEPLIEPALLELRRFLALHALLDAPPTMFSQPVDAAWHAALMFTRRYADLCEQAAGRLIHHHPRVGHDFSGPTAPPEAQARFRAFCAAYERYFGPIHPLWTYDRPWATAAGARRPASRRAT
jgi:hypothetical protein